MRAPLPADPLAVRSIRFALTVTGPLAVALVAGDGAWVAYAVLAAILGFTLEGGGGLRERIATFLVAGLVVVAGTGVGTLASGSEAAVVVALAGAGFLYALVEPIHPSLAVAARFLCLALPIGALYVPLQPVDIAAVAAVVVYGVAVSLAVDRIAGLSRAAPAPVPRAVLVRLRASGAAGVAFALIVAAAVAGAFLTAEALGLHRAHWALFAVVVILRSDEAARHDAAVSLVAGTPLGVGAALLYAAAFPSEFGLAAGLAVAALLRWPAERLNGTLGIAALTAFILLLFDLIALSTGVPSNAPVDRLIDVALGCTFAALAIGAIRLARAAFDRAGQGVRRLP